MTLNLPASVHRTRTPDAVRMAAAIFFVYRHVVPEGMGVFSSEMPPNFVAAAAAGLFNTRGQKQR